MPTLRHCSRACLTTVLVVGLACSSSEAPAPSTDILATEVSLYTSLNEEVVIRDFFQDRRGGSFLDVGCMTPIASNTTYYLEEHLGWSGIGVDAVGAYAKAWEDARPRSQFFAYAVSDRSGETVPFYRLKIKSLSALSRDASLFAMGGTPTELQVETITLNKLLEDNGVTVVDFVSISVNGSELDALRGFDLKRFKPELVRLPTPSTEGLAVDLLEYFAESGYELIDRYTPYESNNWFLTPGSRSEPF